MDPKICCGRFVETPCRKHLEDKGCDSMRFPCPGFMEILSFSPKYSYITWLGLASPYPTCTVVFQSHVPSGKKRSGRDRQGRHETILAIPFLRNRDDYQGWIIGEQQCHPDNCAWELQHFGEKMPVSWWLWWISRTTSAPLNLNTVTYHRIHIRCVKKHTCENTTTPVFSTWYVFIYRCCFPWSPKGSWELEGPKKIRQSVLRWPLGSLGSSGVDELASKMVDFLSQPID